ncbi:MAG: calcium/sodium antiporter [Bacteroidales bacterium]
MSSAISNLIFISIGLILVAKGANWFVHGSSSLAKKLNVSELAIGLTIVAFGTSSPELIVNIFAAIGNHPELILSNVLGSNNLNLFVVLGVAGIITPLTVHSSTAWKEIPFSLIIVVVLAFLANGWFMNNINQEISRIESIILLGLFIFFLIYVYKQLILENKTKKTDEKTLSGFQTWSKIIVGLAGLIIGGKIVVKNAIDLAEILNVSEKIIGITIVALGTSIPELATSVTAAMRKNTDIAVGNIIGSNIFNILLVLPISALIRPITFNNAFNTEIYILGGGTLFLFITMYTGKIKKLDRWEAVILLAFYAGYTVKLLM